MRALASCLALALSCCSDGRSERIGGRDGGTMMRNVPRPGLSFDPVPIEGYCEAAARAECHRLAVCAPITLASLHGTSLDCERSFTERCERVFVELNTIHAIDLDLISYDPAAMGAALAEHTRRHCNSTVPTPTPFEAIAGLIEEAAQCADDELCVSGYCERTGERCGRCRPRPPGRPSSCPSRCVLGRRCACQTPDGGARACECAPAIAERGDCSGDRGGCDEGLRCLDVRDGSGTRKTLCLPIPAEGEACGPSTGFAECIGEAYCPPGDRPRCTRPALVSERDACETRIRLCEPGFDCRGVCVRRARMGEPCSSPPAPDGGAPNCAEGLCAGNCQAPSGTGTFCLELDDCQHDLGCFGGLGGGTCEAWETVRMRTEERLVCP